MLCTVRRFATADSVCHSSFGFPPLPTYACCVKLILLCVLAVACLSFAGCASKKPKSGYRNYEGDSSPGITMFEEKPGYPLNTR